MPWLATRSAAPKGRLARAVFGEPARCAKHGPSATSQLLAVRHTLVSLGHGCPLGPQCWHRDAARSCTDSRMAGAEARRRRVCKCRWT